jgi:hypothetical protein
VLNLAWLAKLPQFQHPEKILHLLGVAPEGYRRRSHELRNVYDLPSSSLKGSVGSSKRQRLNRKS